MSAIGSTAVTALPAVLDSTPPSPLLDTICGWAISASDADIDAFRLSTMWGA